MRQGEAPVRSQEKEVGTATFPIFDTVSEAQTTLGDEKILELLNSIVKQNAMNKVRAEATAEPSRKALQAQAMARITKDEFNEAAGDFGRIQKLIDRYTDQILEERKAKQEANGTGGTTPA